MSWRRKFLKILPKQKVEYKKGGTDIVFILLYHEIIYILDKFFYAPNIEELNLIIDNFGGQT